MITKGFVRFRDEAIALLLASALGSFPVAPRVDAAEPALKTYGVAPDGAVLQWVVYRPKGNGPWPVVIVIHAGGFRTGVHGPQNVCADLAAAGFAAVAIDYRLDSRKNLLPTQPAPVFFAPPANLNQTLDIQAAVNAARHPTSSRLAGNVTDWVGAIGGSTGGLHALWVAATGTLADTKVNAAAMLS